MLLTPAPGHDLNAGWIALAQSAFQGLGFMTSKPSFENVTEAPPWLPAKHLSGPDTHPTPGHQTYDPGHSACLEAPAMKKTATANTATTIYQVQRGICLRSRLLLLRTACLSLASGAFCLCLSLSSLSNSRIDIQQSCAYVTFLLCHLYSIRILLSGTGITTRLGFLRKYPSRLPHIHQKDNQCEKEYPSHHL
jgi:hypothetical protein